MKDVDLATSYRGALSCGVDGVECGVLLCDVVQCGLFCFGLWCPVACMLLFYEVLKNGAA